MDNFGWSMQNIWLCKLFRAMRKWTEILKFDLQVGVPFYFPFENECLWSFVDLLFMRTSVDQMERVSEDLIAMADHNSWPAKWHRYKKLCGYLPIMGVMPPIYTQFVQLLLLIFSAMNFFGRGLPESLKAKNRYKMICDMDQIQKRATKQCSMVLSMGKRYFGNS